MTVLGIDLSTYAVDCVKLELDSDRATWERFDLRGADAFDRARDVGRVMPSRAMSWWDDVYCVGIEAPFGPNKNTLLRVQGAILTCIPAGRLVQPWPPQSWRKHAGMSGHASKEEVALFAIDRWENVAEVAYCDGETQDTFDAFCIALATRSLIQKAAA